MKGRANSNYQWEGISVELLELETATNMDDIFIGGSCGNLHT